MSLHDEPSERDKFEDLQRQYANFQRDPSTVIFCPWCMKGNKAGEPACCAFFTDSVERIGREQLASVERQFRNFRATGGNGFRGIKCPYCATLNKPPQPGDGPESWPRPFESPWCCNLLHDAATALTERIMSDRLAEQRKRIEDKVSAN